MAQREVRQLSEAELRNLADDQKNVVYHFKERERLPQSEILPLDEVKSKVLRLYAEYEAERKVYIDAKRAIRRSDWERIVRKLKNKPEWQRFDYTHPLIVDRILNPETTRKEIKALLFMIWWKEKDGDLETFKEYIFKEFARSAPGAV